MVDIDISRAAMNDAAERATREHRSLTDVIDTLLRDYAAGRTWLNLRDAGDVTALGHLHVPDGTVKLVAEILYHRYEDEHPARHLTWRDFAESAREILEVAMPALLSDGGDRG